jgi:hypothetical protein
VADRHSNELNNQGTASTGALCAAAPLSPSRPSRHHGGAVLVRVGIRSFRYHRCRSMPRVRNAHHAARPLLWSLGRVLPKDDMDWIRCLGHLSRGQPEWAFSGTAEPVATDTSAPAQRHVTAARRRARTWAVPSHMRPYSAFRMVAVSDVEAFLATAPPATRLTNPAPNDARVIESRATHVRGRAVIGYCPRYCAIVSLLHKCPAYRPIRTALAEFLPFRVHILRRSSTITVVASSDPRRLPVRAADAPQLRSRRRRRDPAHLCRTVSGGWRVPSSVSVEEHWFAGDVADFGSVLGDVVEFVDVDAFDSFAGDVDGHVGVGAAA